jgi:hypothetical protein
MSRLCPLAALVLPALLVAPSRAVEPAKPTLEEARSFLEQAANEKDYDKAQDLARRALPGLLAADQPGSIDCWLLAATAEAQIRSGDPKGALATIARGANPECDAASFASLAAWAHEYGTDGLRRGKGAELSLSLALYLKAADLLSVRPLSNEPEAIALANAGEIALAIGDTATARDAGLRALGLRPSHDVQVRAGVIVLSAAGPEIGEGAATDLVTAALDGADDVLRDVLDARVAQIGKALDQRPGDPYLLVAAGFYSLFTGGNVSGEIALRHLDKAAQSGFPLPELWYLHGRAEDSVGNHDQAKQDWLRQQKEQPGASATRLAVNDLAYLLATQGGTASEMSAALAALDAQLAKTPKEAAMHETRALLLEKMGRTADALASMQRAQALEPSPEREAAISRLRG